MIEKISTHGIDKTSLQGELYIIVHNKDAHGRKGAIIVVVKGTNPAYVLRVVMQLPASEARSCIKELNRQKTEFRKYLEGLSAQRKAYRERMMAKYGRTWQEAKEAEHPL